MHRLANATKLLFIFRGVSWQVRLEAGALRKAMDRKVKAAETFRDLQIENIRGLYDYEIR